MLEKLADWTRRPVSLRLALAAKVADTHCVDTIADPPNVLKKLSGFGILSRSLDAHFRIEDALTSGFNDDYGCWKMYGDLPGCRKQQGIRDIMGSSMKARRGVGSKYSKEVLKKDREVFKSPSGERVAKYTSGRPGFPFCHQHPMFADNDDLQAICEPFTLNVRSHGDRNADFLARCADHCPGGSSNSLGLEGEDEVAPGLWKPRGSRWHSMCLANGDGSPVMLCCFRLLESISTSHDQTLCNVEVMTAGAGKKAFEAKIMASRELDPSDELCLWMPESPLVFLERSGEGDDEKVSFWHPSCKLATQSQEAMKDLMGPDGQLDPEKITKFAEFMKSNEEEAKTAGLKAPPGGPECPTQ